MVGLLTGKLRILLVYHILHLRTCCEPWFFFLRRRLSAVLFFDVVVPRAGFRSAYAAPHVLGDLACKWTDVNGTNLSDIVFFLRGPIRRAPWAYLNATRASSKEAPRKPRFTNKPSLGTYN